MFTKAAKPSDPPPVRQLPSYPMPSPPSPFDDPTAKIQRQALEMQYYVPPPEQLRKSGSRELARYLRPSVAMAARLEASFQSQGRRNEAAVRHFLHAMTVHFSQMYSEHHYNCDLATWEAEIEPHLVEHKADTGAWIDALRLKGSWIA